MSAVHCINGPELARLLNGAMGKRATERADLSTFSSALREGMEGIERLAQESGSSFKWLRHLQTTLLGDRVVLIATGWDKEGNYDGVWLWERDAGDRTLLHGLRKAEASERLEDRIVPVVYSSRFRLAPLRNAKDVRIPLLADLVADEYWSNDYFSRRTDDQRMRGIPYHQN